MCEVCMVNSNIYLHCCFVFIQVFVKLRLQSPDTFVLSVMSFSFSSVSTLDCEHSKIC